MLQSVLVSPPPPVFDRRVWEAVAPKGALSFFRFPRHNLRAEQSAATFSVLIAISMTWDSKSGVWPSTHSRESARPWVQSFQKA